MRVKWSNNLFKLDLDLPLTLKSSADRLSQLVQPSDQHMGSIRLIEYLINNIRLAFNQTYGNYINLDQLGEKETKIIKIMNLNFWNFPSCLVFRYETCMNFLMSGFDKRFFLLSDRKIAGEPWALWACLLLALTRFNLFPWRNLNCGQAIKLIVF